MKRLHSLLKMTSSLNSNLVLNLGATASVNLYQLFTKISNRLMKDLMSVVYFSRYHSEKEWHTFW